MNGARPQALTYDRALKAFDDGIFDLVITDCAMPGMTGLELAQKIKTRCPETPVVLASGYASLPDGSDTDLPRLPKPFFQRDLERLLATVFIVRAQEMQER